MTSPTDVMDDVWGGQETSELQEECRKLGSMVRKDNVWMVILFIHSGHYITEHKGVEFFKKINKEGKDKSKTNYVMQ